MLPPHLPVPHRGPSEPGESPAGTPGVRPAAGSAPGGSRLNVSDRGGWPCCEGPGAGGDRAPGAVCEGLRRVTAAGSLGWARGWMKTASPSSAASFGALSPHSRGITKQGWHLKLLLAAALWGWSPDRVPISASVPQAASSAFIWAQRSSKRVGEEAGGPGKSSGVVVREDGEPRREAHSMICRV